MFEDQNISDFKIYSKYGEYFYKNICNYKLFKYLIFF